MDKPNLPLEKEIEMVKLSADINYLKAVRLLEKSVSSRSKWRFFSLSSVVIFTGITAALFINPYKPVAANIPPLPAQIKQVPVDLNPAQLAQIIEAVKAKPVVQTRIVKVIKKPTKSKKSVFKTKPKKAKQDVTAISEPFIPEIDRTCPGGYARVQPEICFNNEEKMMIYLRKPKPKT